MVRWEGIAFPGSNDAAIGLGPVGHEVSISAGPSTGNYRQDDMRGVVGIDMNGIDRDLAGPRHPLGRAGIRIDVEMREVAARDIGGDAVTRLEEIARREGLDRDLGDLARRQHFRLLPGSAIAHAEDAVGDVHRETRGIIGVRLVAVDQLWGKIVDGTGGWNTPTHRDGIRTPRGTSERPRYIQLNARRSGGLDDMTP